VSLKYCLIAVKNKRVFVQSFNGGYDSSNLIYLFVGLMHVIYQISSRVYINDG